MLRAKSSFVYCLFSILWDLLSVVVWRGRHPTHNMAINYLLSVNVEIFLVLHYMSYNTIFLQSLFFSMSLYISVPGLVPEINVLIHHWLIDWLIDWFIGKPLQYSIYVLKPKYSYKYCILETCWSKSISVNFFTLSEVLVCKYLF